MIFRRLWQSSSTQNDLLSENVFKFWSDMKRKPGETIPELASRIQQDAATCDFQSIKDPLDEALRTKFICSVDNEAVLKTLFKLKDDELKFSNTIRVAQEVEEAAKVAKETVHGQPSTSVQKVKYRRNRRYSHIQKEALSLVYALRKFHQFLYGRKFIVVTDHKPLVTLFAPDKGTPAMAANRLARWALLVHQYDYTVEYRRSKDHGNAHALSRLPFSNDTSFDGEEMEDDVDSVCLVRTISRQINPDNPLLVVRETAKDPILAQVMRFVKEGWPHAFSEELKDFKKLENSLSTENGCVFYGLRVIIPSTLRNHILKLLHLGHFGMQRMKQLARSTVYWPRIDFDIEDLCRKCTSCGQFQNKPDKPSIHPWMMPEKPWSRLHLDHAINFLGRNWLVLVDAYSKYPCIHPTTSTSSKSTTAILEQ